VTLSRLLRSAERVSQVSSGSIGKKHSDNVLLAVASLSAAAMLRSARSTAQGMVHE